MKRLLLSLPLALSLVFAAPVVSAQPAGANADAPYAPQMVPRDELIDLGTFERSPLRLTFEWKELAVRTVSNYGRMDFEHTFDVPFKTFMARMEEAYTNGDDVMELDADIISFSNLTHLKIIGLQPGASNSKLTIGAPGLTRHFILEARAEGNHTVVTFRNAAYSMLFSGVMPARAPFLPALAEPVRFRWN